jgi:hypothetical protein
VLNYSVDVEDNWNGVRLRFDKWSRQHLRCVAEGEKVKKEPKYLA